MRICDEIFDGIGCEMSRDSTEPVALLSGRQVGVHQRESARIRNQSKRIYLQPPAGSRVLR